MEKINLQHLVACQQSWSDMTPTERGRICGQCNKTIVDFREMSDKEVAHIHVFEDRNVCGVYRPDQLTEKIHQAEVSSWKLVCRKSKSIAIGIVGLFSTINSNSQNELTSTPTEQSEIIPSEIPDTLLEKDSAEILAFQDSIIISGIVSNSEGGAIQHGIVVVKGTEKGTMTAIDGFYSLDISDQILENGEAILEFRYLGYMDTLIYLKIESLQTQSSRNIDVAFPDYSIQTTTQVSQFYAYVEPEKKSPWQKFINLFKVKNKED